MKILIIGATSAIAQAVAQYYAKNKATLYLMARNEEKLNDLVADLTVRGAENVYSQLFDAKDTNRYEQLISEAFSILSKIDIILIAHGNLPNQTCCENSLAETLTSLQINAISIIAFSTLIANKLKEQKSGTLAVISSVAGDRGRQSNYIYGTAKGSLNIFLQGLRNRLYKNNVHVLTIKPGFVDTPMTKDFKKGFLWAQPNKIAIGIIKAIERKKNTVYLPPIWLWIMFIIRYIPEFIFKRMNL